MERDMAIRQDINENHECESNDPVDMQISPKYVMPPYKDRIKIRMNKKANKIINNKQ